MFNALLIQKALKLAMMEGYYIMAHFNFVDLCLGLKIFANNFTTKRSQTTRHYFICHQSISLYKYNTCTRISIKMTFYCFTNVSLRYIIL